VFGPIFACSIATVDTTFTTGRFRHVYTMACWMWGTCVVCVCVCVFVCVHARWVHQGIRVNVRYM
jgi:hypothetical protein